MITRTATVPAYAKINLGLRVLYKRPDGFHELRTIFQTISLADRLSIRYTPAPETVISIEGAPHIPDNLVERAAHAVLSELGLQATVAFTLTKRIPMGAGLGGGSTDAAAVLLALPVLAGQGIAPARLAEIAATLGSDVPFFLTGGTALGLGKGEELYSLPDLPPRPGILLAPGIHVSTPNAYRDLSLTLTHPMPKIALFQQSASSPLTEPLYNDFEAVVFPAHPTLLHLKQQLTECGAAPVLMSGSGSSIFGLFNRKETRDRVVQSWSGKGVYSMTLLTGAAYRSRWLRHLTPHIEGKLWPPRSRYAR